ncbi:MAG: DUF2344 domain-containing protein [Clostridia bacterium]|nr:DUF2344 domain-containing protein [Clostridia bacterium]
MLGVRLTFAKEGRALFISHLDLMRCMSRGICRAGLPVYYTQGFNPQPYLVFSPPLSLGYGGAAEICDFSLLDEGYPVEEVVARLRAVMPEGVRPIATAVPVHKLGALALADWEIRVGAGMTAADVAAARDCLDAPEILVLKKSKRGEREVNIRPMIASLTAAEEGGALVLRCRLPLAGENALNPKYLVEVLGRSLPQFADADFFALRTAFYLEDGTPFC